MSMHYADKFVFGKDTVECAGFEISLTSVNPCSKVLQSIKDFPTPRNVRHPKLVRAS